MRTIEIQVPLMDLEPHLQPMVVAVDEAIGADFPQEATQRLLLGFCDYLTNYFESYDHTDNTPAVDITSLNETVGDIFAGGRQSYMQQQLQFPVVFKGFHEMACVIKPYLLEYLFSLGYMDETITYVQHRYINARPALVGFILTSEPFDDTAFSDDLNGQFTAHQRQR